MSHPPHRLKFLKVGLKYAQRWYGTELVCRIMIGPHWASVVRLEVAGTDFCAFGPLFRIIPYIQLFDYFYNLFI